MKVKINKKIYQLVLVIGLFLMNIWGVTDVLADELLTPLQVKVEYAHNAYDMSTNIRNALLEVLPSDYQVDEIVLTDEVDYSCGQSFDCEAILRFGTDVQTVQVNCIIQRHAFESWKVIKSPTQNEKGKKSGTCVNCGVSETRVIIPTGYMSEQAQTLSDGERLVLMEQNIVIADKRMNFYCELDSLDDGIIRLGHGKTAYDSAYIEITTTHLIVHSYYNASTNTAHSYEHGLDISEWIEVSIEKGTGNAKITITTASGTHTGSYSWSSGQNGPIFCETEGVLLENVACSWYCEGFSEDIWFFGDSFFSVSMTSRWPYYLIKDGHGDVLLAGYAGMGASTGLVQFKSFLDYETPKYAVWCLGMNNGDNDTKINQTWLENTKEFIELCKKNGIEPILSTIPSTPKVNNRLKNEWVENSGYRYIDFDLAVVENHITGEWLENMLASDKVHPKVLGAQALYRQVLADFPEVTDASSNVCTHSLAEMGARPAECEYGGRLNYWVCTICGGTFADTKASILATAKDIKLGPAGHDYFYGKCTLCGEIDPDYVAPENPFLDVTEDKYYYRPVLWAVDNRITSGFTPTMFMPDMACTRAQAVTFLWNAVGRPEPSSTKNPFVDISADQYYYKPVLWAVSEGITSGTMPDTFSPDEFCTRSQIVTFLWRSKNRPEPKTATSPFGDVANKNEYYYRAVLWAVEEGITSGATPTEFWPNEFCTRSQIVTFLCRDIIK